MGETLTLLVGTTKGTFLLSGDRDRPDWAVSGPHCGGWPINHVLGDPDSGTLWAGGGDPWSGAGIWRSTDGGQTWSLARLSRGSSAAWLEQNPEIAAQIGMEVPGPAPFDGEVDAIWSLGLAGDTIYAGGKPGRLYRSADRGESWTAVTGLNDHPERGNWHPGAAGLTLHTIVASPEDPARLWVGISAAGVFASEDGGESWERRGRRANASAELPDHPAAGDAQEIGGCVHNAVRAPGGPGDLLYQQNHHGVFRSPDGGRSWEDVGAGLPSRFGFPIAVHPRDPGTLWVLPLNGDTQGRYPPDAAAAVWKTTDGGATWRDCREGLPQENCYFTVLRQAMATDRGTPAGVYFGTNSGSVFASRDEGEGWQEIARHLPTVLAVECLHRA